LKIAKLELENVKRVRAVELEPAMNGMTIIGGKNGQGKTSVLDAIAWALGGEKYRPSSSQREGSVIPPRLHVVLDNGIIVDREGKNSSLKVTDPTGKRAGQQLLDEFIEKLALDLPKFLNQNNKEKAATLLKVIGMEAEVKSLDDEENAAYNRRHALGQIADQKEKYAAEMPDYPGAPEEIISASELIQQQQAILLKNAENQKKRDLVVELAHDKQRVNDEIARLQEQAQELNRRIEGAKINLAKIEEDELIAQKSAADLEDESTAELEESLQKIDEINAQVRANMEKDKAVNEAAEIRAKYNDLTGEIESIRKKRVDLLASANLPLPDLTVENGELLYRGKAWDCMSSSEQMIVAVAIVRALNPKCGFVLLDKTEQMDIDTLNEFGKWLEKEGLQAICTRVSTGEECEIIIEDGVSVKRQPNKKAAVNNQEAPVPKAWKEGEF
jgi:predicted ATP-dependent endonuclease of OLD family